MDTTLKLATENAHHLAAFVLERAVEAEDNLRVAYAANNNRGHKDILLGVATGLVEALRCILSSDERDAAEIVRERADNLS